MPITSTSGTSVSPEFFQFLGTPTKSLPEFPYKIKSFFIKPWQDMDVDGVLERYLGKMQELFQKFYDTAEVLQELTSYEKCPVHLLQYLDDILSIDSRNIRNLESLREIDHRRLIKVMAYLWKYRGTPTAYSAVIRVFTGKQYRLLHWPYWKTILDEDFLSLESDFLDAWYLTDSGSAPDHLWSHLRVVDEGYQTINRELFEDLCKINLVTSESLAIRYLLFLDRAESLQQWIVKEGAIVKNEGTFEVANGMLAFTEVAYDETWENYALKAKIKLRHSGTETSALSKARLLVYAQDKNNYYALEIDEYANQVKMLSVISSVESTLRTFSVDILDDVWYTWHIVLDGTNAQVLQDGVLLGNVTIPSTFTKGQIGLQTGTAGAIDTELVVDEIEVYPVRNFLGLAQSSHISQDIYMSPKTTSMAVNTTKEFKVWGGFEEYFATVNSGEVVGDFFFNDGFWRINYKAPSGAGVAKLTITDKYDNKVIATITVTS